MDSESIAGLLPAAAGDALRWRGVDVADRDQLTWAAAVGIVTHLLRTTVWEDWHAGPGGLDGPDLMRDTASLTRQAHQALAEQQLPDWHRVAALMTAPHRVLPDGRTLGHYARGDRALRDLTGHALRVADLLSAIAVRGPWLALLYAAMQTCHCSSEQWWGMPAWPLRVERFVALQPGRERLPAGTSLDELESRLLEGPDRLDREMAAWCLGHGLDGCLAEFPLPLRADWVPGRQTAH